jgi:hypothetical protein
MIDRFAMAAVQAHCPFVLARPAYRACPAPHCFRRPMACSTPTRRRSVRRPSGVLAHWRRRFFSWKSP